MKKAILTNLVGVFLTGLATSLWAQHPYVTRVLMDNPLAYYQFEEAPGSTVFSDSTGNGYDGTDVANAVFGMAGVIGNGVRLNGDGSLLTGLTMNPADPEGDGAGVGNDDFSIEMFVTVDDASVFNQVFISQQDGGGLGRSVMLLNGVGMLGSFLGGSTGSSTVQPESGRWYHFILTYDGAGGADAIRYYVDGMPAGSHTETAEAAMGNWVIGAHKARNRQFTAGMIDEVAFYAYRLDDPNGDNDTSDSLVPLHWAAVPEPSVLALLGLGVLSWLGWRRKA